MKKFFVFLLLMLSNGVIWGMEDILSKIKLSSQIEKKENPVVGGTKYIFTVPVSEGKIVATRIDTMVTVDLVKRDGEKSLLDPGLFQEIENLHTRFC